MQVIVGWLVSALMTWLAKYFEDHLAAYEADKAKQQEAVAQAAQETKKASQLSPNSKVQEVSDAIKDETSSL